MAFVTPLQQWAQQREFTRDFGISARRERALECCGARGV
jgi:hypothetical protein